MATKYDTFARIATNYFDQPIGHPVVIVQWYRDDLIAIRPLYQFDRIMYVEQRDLKKF